MSVFHVIQLISLCIQLSNKLPNFRDATCEIVSQKSQCCVNSNTMLPFFSKLERHFQAGGSIPDVHVAEEEM
jgi:hypothetical protein